MAGRERHSLTLPGGRHLLPHRARRREHVLERLDRFVVPAGLETAIRVYPDLALRDRAESGFEQLGDLLDAGYAGRVDVVDTRPDATGKAAALQFGHDLHLRARRLDRRDVSIQAVDGIEHH